MASQFISPVSMTCAAIFSTAASAGRIHCVNPQPAANATAIEIEATKRFIGSSPLRYFSFYGQGDFRILEVSIAKPIIGPYFSLGKPIFYVSQRK